MKTSTKIQLKNSLLYSLIVSACILLVACGGGSSSDGSGSSVSTAKESSTIVLNTSNIGGIATIQKLKNTKDYSLIAEILNLVLPEAWANHITVLLNGINFGTTHGGEDFLIAVTPGSYELALLEGSVSCSSVPISIEPDTIVTLSILDTVIVDDTCNFTYERSDRSALEDEVISGGGNSPSGKTLVCHKGKKQLSVSVNAVEAHLAHGDVTGPCPREVETPE
jgi:hypothetical protein